ncbi:acetyl-CoA hydrolase/transferase C-terminal domain-containing protein [Halalkalicoccus salilacus]|uniref:acetyl-CoA hydrolase/transferase C-terminal domain-containing protein n=1 Tax=Halalkalicoccus salilacus TaxID=3117459 RepID=UPI00300F6C70
MSESSNDRLEGALPITSADEAAGVVDNGMTVAISGFGSVGYPKSVPRALDGHQSLTILSAGSVGGEIDEKLVKSGTIDRRAHFQSRPAIRDAINAGDVAFFDRHVSQFGDELRFNGGLDVDIAIIEAVAVGDDWFIPSTSIGHAPSMVRAADRLILEVNHAQPVALKSIHDVYERTAPPHREPIPIDGPIDRIGNARIGFDPDALNAVVETNTADDPYTFRTPTASDQAIATNLGSFLGSEIQSNPMFSSTVSMQFGVGSLGNALMGTLTEIEFGDRTVIYFGEVFQDGLLNMLDSGRLAGASATSLALSNAGQERFFDEIDQYAKNVVLRPADLSNNPALIERFGVIGVNSAIEVDCYGNANATHIGGIRMISGIGGGGDFVRNSRLSIIALPSTAANGAVSRVVPMIPHVDHSEHDVSVIVTEHGVADLRGCSPRERAAKILEIADPAFRNDLEAYRDRAAEGRGQTPHDLETAFDWHIEWNE